MRRLLVLVVLSAALSASATPSKILRHATAVPGRYLVALATEDPSSVDGLSTSLAKAYGLALIETYPYSLRGFLVQGAEANVLALSDDPRVRYAEQDASFTMDLPRTSATQWTTYQAGPNTYQWNLDRLDELSRADRDSTHNMCTEGRSVYAYIIDSGVYSNHEQFESPSRVVLSRDFYNGALGTAPDPSNGCTIGLTRPNRGYHGTAVASVLAGTQIGAAKTQIVSLRALPCERFAPLFSSDFARAMNWIGDGTKNPYRLQPGVINMSAYTPPWDPNFAAISDAAKGIVQTTGYPFFTSANNYSTDACNFSPAATRDGANNVINRAYTKYNKPSGGVFVVGATGGGPDGDNNDYRWQNYTVNDDGSVTANIDDSSGSNTGACVSIFAPGDDISFAMHSGTANYGLDSGTSFASPHAAALGARYIEKQIATTGVRPTYQQAYEFLLNKAQTVVQHTATHAGYYMCVRNGVATASRTPCPSDYTSYWMPQASNTSDARMLFWDEGTCWP